MHLTLAYVCVHLMLGPSMCAFDVKSEYVCILCYVIFVMFFMYVYVCLMLGPCMCAFDVRSEGIHYLDLFLYVQLFDIK